MKASTYLWWIVNVLYQHSYRKILWQIIGSEFFLESTHYTHTLIFTTTLKKVPWGKVPPKGLNQPRGDCAVISLKVAIENGH